MNNKNMRYHLLDGTRGIAALGVLIYHFTQSNGLNWLPGAWAAVDLFFVLSGFVIAHSYGKKLLDGMTFRQYLHVRLVRLVPLYLLGIILGIAAVLMEPSPVNIGLLPAGVPYASLLNALGLPYFSFGGMLINGGMINVPVFPLNPPAWSLFFEFLINVVFYFYVLRSRRFSSLTLVMTVFLLFAGFSVVSRIFNPGWDAETFIFALPRVTYGFFFGALIFQLKIQEKVFPPLLIIALAVAMGYLFLLGSPKAGVLNSMIFMPLAIALFSTVQVGKLAQQICSWLGEISYPLYVLHVPFHRLVIGEVEAMFAGKVTQTVIMVFITLTVAFAASMADKWFRKRFFANGKSVGVKIETTTLPS
ncbi:MAG: acyltransferase family protein [Janthinobacterium lividum]